MTIIDPKENSDSYPAFRIVLMVILYSAAS